MKRNMRAVLSSAGAITMVAAMVGCSPTVNKDGGADPTQSNTTATEGPTELLFWTNLNVDAQAKVIQAQAESCAAAMDGDVTVKFEAIPFDQMYTRLATAFRSGNGPDIMNTLEGAVAFSEDAGYLVPVDDVVDAHGRDDFLPSYLAAVQKDDKTWGVPDWALHQEVWYRTDLFEANNIEIPKTWDELKAAAEKLNSPDEGTFGFAVPMGSAMVGPQTYYQFLYANNVFTFDPETGEYAFDADPAAAEEATEYMIDLYSAASPPESRTWGWPDFRNGFVEGKVAMTNDFGAVVGIAQEQNPEMLEKISAFPMPAKNEGDTTGGMLGGGYYYMVGKTGAEREALSGKLIECMMEPDAAAERANTRPVFAIPATNSAAESQVYNSNETVQQFADEIAMIREQTAYRYGMEAGLNPLAGQIEATTFIGDALQAAAAGTITPAEATLQINEELRRLSGN